jgi:hypothetical protein
MSEPAPTEASAEPEVASGATAPTPGDDYPSSVDLEHVRRAQAGMPDPGAQQADEPAPASPETEPEAQPKRSSARR